MNERSSKTLVFDDADNGGIIHIANIKGGVGKSTVATNLAAAISKRGPTLIIDLDVQGSATVALGKDPSEVPFSSWNLFANRYHPDMPQTRSGGLFSRVVGPLESLVFPGIVGRGSITSIALKVQDCLDLIPAHADLFKPVSWFKLQNLLYNLELCRSCYKYIIIDTPSVWNRMTRQLYLNSDLNLIPVTLNALSTKSLRDYLNNVKNLAEQNQAVRIRIVKNEVFGRTDSKIKGKTRTMVENRKFLDSLCEQVVIRSTAGMSFLPQSLMFDLEIPESATVRDAQDEGKSVSEFQVYSAISKAFEELSKRVQYVLNNHKQSDRMSSLQSMLSVLPYAARALAIVVIVMTVAFNKPVFDVPAPRPLAPQQLIQPADGVIVCTISENESLYKMAKYAICYFRARVPSNEEIFAYVKETAQIHNLTRMSGEATIDDIDRVRPGTIVSFYPPSHIANDRQKQLVPVFRYFSVMVDDPYSYITGDWCERGTGGGSPHYGIDVAAKLGSDIISPIDGTVIIKNSGSAGHVLGVIKEGMVLFFCHMDHRYFASGDMVRKGDVVGTVGMTGQSSGPHVHVGYGVKSPATDGVNFGRGYYKVTDPKLFFYREVFVNSVASK